MFARGDFESLARLLQNIQGRFILSINDAGRIRELFSGSTIETVRTTYAELLIRNFRPLARIIPWYLADQKVSDFKCHFF